MNYLKRFDMGVGRKFDEAIGGEYYGFGRFLVIRPYFFAIQNALPHRTMKCKHDMNLK